MLQQPLIPVSDSDQPDLVSYPKVASEFLEQAWPFFVTRFIELGIDFFAMSLLSQIDDEHEAAGSLISSFIVFLRNINATFVYYIAPYTKQHDNLTDRLVVGSIIQQGWLLTCILGGLSIILASQSKPILISIGQPSISSGFASDFLTAYSWGLPFTLMSVACQQMTIGLSKPRVVLVMTALTQPLILLFGYPLLFGKFGFPNLGASGLGYAYSISAFANFVGFLIAFSTMDHFKTCNIFQNQLRGSFKHFWEILKKGLPIGIYAAIELGSISIATFFMGNMGKFYLRAVQPAVRYASLIANLTFAVGAVIGVLVKKSENQNQPYNTIRYGNTSIILTHIIPLIVLILFVSSKDLLINLFIDINRADDSQLVNTAHILLMINLIGQIPDTIRNATSGALRGFNETMYPMYANMIPTLLLNIPLAAVGYWQNSAWGILAARTFGISVSALFIYKKWHTLSHKNQPMISECCSRICPRLFGRPERKPVGGLLDADAEREPTDTEYRRLESGPVIHMQQSPIRINA